LRKKESFRWLEGYRLACKSRRGTGRKQKSVSIADREADIYECFLEGAATRPASPCGMDHPRRENRSFA